MRRPISGASAAPSSAASGERVNGRPDPAALAAAIKDWGRALGFRRVGITGTDLGAAEARLTAWLAAGCHGEMAWMARHGTRRTRPAELVPGTRSVIMAAMDYLPEPLAVPPPASPADLPPDSLNAPRTDPQRAVIARYALGRDYHRVLRRRLQALAERIGAAVGPFGHRVFVDSGPVMEKPLAAAAGLGWIGKHTNLIDRRAGSWFFLATLYTDLDLPHDPPATDHCGRCRACLDACPTGAITAPYRLDARRCIAYLTIEHPGPIPEPLRPLIGDRIFGCDDCQLCCPWNRFARPTAEPDFRPRPGLAAATLAGLFAWDEMTFLTRTEGTPLRRLGHDRWLRNLAVAMGNARPEPDLSAALAARAGHPSPLVREHVQWALVRQCA